MNRNSMDFKSIIIDNIWNTRFLLEEDNKIDYLKLIVDKFKESCPRIILFPLMKSTTNEISMEWPSVINYPALNIDILNINCHYIDDITEGIFDLQIKDHCDHFFNLLKFE